MVFVNVWQKKKKNVTNLTKNVTDLTKKVTNLTKNVTNFGSLNSYNFWTTEAICIIETLLSKVLRALSNLIKSEIKKENS